MSLAFQVKCYRTSASCPWHTTTASPSSSFRSLSGCTSSPWARSCNPGSPRTGRTGTILERRQERILTWACLHKPCGVISSSPQFLQKISDAKLRVWAEELHQIWKKLGKKVAAAWACFMAQLTTLGMEQSHACGDPQCLKAHISPKNAAHTPEL